MGLDSVHVRDCPETRDKGRHGGVGREQPLTSLLDLTSTGMPAKKKNASGECTPGDLLNIPPEIQEVLSLMAGRYKGVDASGRTHAESEKMGQKDRCVGCLLPGRL